MAASDRLTAMNIAHLSACSVSRRALIKAGMSSVHRGVVRQSRWSWAGVETSVLHINLRLGCFVTGVIGTETLHVVEINPSICHGGNNMRNCFLHYFFNFILFNLTTI